ncbi:phage distal tail protein [Streptomyces sp. NPDC021012]|uniref:phage distal tail protein n=1 Tax=Streptomyces sp. NPDC021012 TaxID=3365107 RepID=UPI0037A49572
MTDPILTTGQLDLAGTVIGKGTVVQIRDITGLGRPPVRDNDADQPSLDGAWPGPDYYAARPVQIDAAIRTPGNRAAALDVLAALQQTPHTAAVRLTAGATQALRIAWPGRPVKRLFGRVRRLDATVDKSVFGFIPLDIEFLATDPLWYADTESTVEIPLGWLTGGGFAAPVVAPIYVQDGTVAADRPGWVTNNGTTDTWPVIRITGPCAQVTVTHVPTGRALQLPTLNLTAGQWIEIDTRPGYRTVTRENGGNALALLSPASRIDQFSLPPGTSEMRWTAFDNTNSSRMRLTWRDAYTAL